MCEICRALVNTANVINRSINSRIERPSCVGGALLCPLVRGLESIFALSSARRTRTKTDLGRSGSSPQRTTFGGRCSGDAQSGRKPLFVLHNPIMWPGCGVHTPWHRDRKLLTRKANRSFINQSEFHTRQTKDASQMTLGRLSTPPSSPHEPADTWR